MALVSRSSLLNTRVCMLCKKVTSLHSATHNSFWSILQRRFSCKSFRPGITERNKKDSKSPE